jgi:hypothetical protein
MNGNTIIQNPAVPELKIPVELSRDHVTFNQFIFRNKTNRNYLLIASIASIIQFVVFKLLYPFADFFSDSYSYIYGAYANLDINIWPIGYSWFLRYFHFITTSDTAVVAFQYFFLILASLVFFFTIGYFFKPNKSAINILFAFLFFNPLFLYIGNYINSDPLFAAISLLWLSQLIWIIQRPMLYQVVTHGILLYLCFIVRNNAIIYPFISAFAFLLSNHRRFSKVLGIGFGSFLVILFINHQRDAAQRVIGQKEFSFFTGWQLANNALYMYNHIEVDSNALPSEEAREMNRLSKEFYSHVRPEFDQYLTVYVANFFIRQPEAPLKTYFRAHFNPKTEKEKVRDWGKAGLVFGEFGKHLMKEHPGAYARHFMLRNVKNYFLSPLEKLEVYNLGSREVWPIAVEWFKYKSKEAKAFSFTFQGRLLSLFPAFFLFINACFVFGVVLSWIKGLYKQQDPFIWRSVLLIATFWFANLAFSVFATINVLRYQFFPMLVCVAFTAVVVSWMDEKKKITIPTLPKLPAERTAVTNY